MSGLQGTPCWYELATHPEAMEAAAGFYEGVFGWSVTDAGMEGFDYRLARSGGETVAGLMPMPGDAVGMPPFWMIYFAVDDADATAAAITDAGGQIHHAPADIPGTGRFANAADPQGAAFGILAPAPMEPGCEGSGNAFDQKQAGHGNWNELRSTAPEAGFAFYSGLFGWQKSTAVDMDSDHVYQLFSHGGTDIGGMTGLGDAPLSCWMPYFGVNGVEAAIGRIEAGGGEKIHGPTEVPGGAFIAIARDPQGAHFAVVGPKETS